MDYLALSEETYSGDFTKMNSLKHVFVPGKGRGIIATKNIKQNELVLVDHPIQVMGSGDYMQIVLNINAKTKKMDTKSSLDLVSKLHALIKYDGLLARKLLSLDPGSNKDEETKLELVDLECMGYHQLSTQGIYPFFPQFPNFVTFYAGKDISMLNHTFVDGIVRNNSFQWAPWVFDQNKSGSCLPLRASLFNHSSTPNCIYVPLKDSMAVFAITAINAGDELTIRYRDKDLTHWGIE